MSGDYTKVPLRADERWTGARLQQGRVLLEHEWNLNLDAAARGARDALADLIGAAGIAAGSTAFAVTADPAIGVAADLQLAPGRMWVGGLEALAPAAFTYSRQDAPLPPDGAAAGATLPAPAAGDRLLVYLDVFAEHVAPAEAPGELIDPALAPADSAARTRIGWRVRALRTKKITVADAMAELVVARPRGSTGFLTVRSEVSASNADPCDPPGSGLAAVPDGLLRVEVLDSGTPATARVAWAYDGGASAVAVRQIEAAVPAAGSVSHKVHLRPSAAVKFAVGDKVEVSWLTRRADRVDHGELHAVTRVATGPGGEEVTISRASAGVPDAAVDAPGLALRRWDGSATGLDGEVEADLGDTDAGVRLATSGGDDAVLLAGDWWGAAVRAAASPPVEARSAAPPDGTPHHYGPLALLSPHDSPPRTLDARPVFRPVVETQAAGLPCTITARPSDTADLQKLADSLPKDGGELCLSAGLYELTAPLVLTGRQRVVISGVGPGTVLRAQNPKGALVLDGCRDVTVTSLRFEGDPGTELRTPPDDLFADPPVTERGALLVLASTGVRVTDCDFATLPARSGTHTRPDPSLRVCGRTSFEDPLTGDVRVERNRFEVGPNQTGLEIDGVRSAHVAGNEVRAAVPGAGLRGFRVQGPVETLVLLDNRIEGVDQCVWLDTHGLVGTRISGSVLVARNVLNPTVIAARRSSQGHVITVSGYHSVQITDTLATLRRTGDGMLGETAHPIDAIYLPLHGPYVVVRYSSLSGFQKGVKVGSPAVVYPAKLWVVQDTLLELPANGNGKAVSAGSPPWELARNYPSG